MNQETETHLEYSLHREKAKTPEELYIDYKNTYIYLILSKIQRKFDEKGFHQMLAYLVMVIFTFDYLDRTGNHRETREFLKFTGWSLDRYSELSGKNLEDKITLAVNIEYPQLPEDEKSEIIKMVKASWKWLNLDKNETENFEKIIDEKRRLYKLIDTLHDRERLNIIEFLRENMGTETSIELMNIGIVPTELCVNNCRFCVAAWKSKPEERGKSITPEDFKRIASEVMTFANKENLIVTVTGGEPFLELDRLEDLISRADSRIDITTSGIWASSEEKAYEVLSRIDRARKKNTNKNFHMSLQLSLDAFHQEVFHDERGNYYQNVPVEYLINIINVIHKKIPEIELVLLTKLSVYPDPLVQLILRLGENGYTVRLGEKFYKESIKIPIIEGSDIITKPALLKAYMYLVPRGTTGQEVQPILIFYTAVESIGKASALEEFEFPGFRREVKQFLEGKFPEPLPLIGIEVSDDGLVYPGAHSLYTWSIGDVLHESLDEIYDRIKYDPLVRALNTSPYLIVKIAFEAEELELERESSPLAAVYKVLERPELRLYITKRLLQELLEYNPFIRKLRIPEKKYLLRDYKNAVKNNTIYKNE